jgi:two-component system sensor histidine kinase and response regulator WspE
MSSGLEDFSLFDLFRMEAEEQVRVLQSELLELESGNATDNRLEALMRASHSLKGAARIVGLNPVVALTHAMEDRFVKAQAGSVLDAADIDRMLAALDWLMKLQATADSETQEWLNNNGTAIEAFAASFTSKESESLESPEPRQTPTATIAANAEPATSAVSPPLRAPAAALVDDEDIFGASAKSGNLPSRERSVRIGAERFDQLLSLASETLVTAQQLTEAGEVLERHRRNIVKALRLLEDPATLPVERASAGRDIERASAALSESIADCDALTRANERTVGSLYRTVLAGRLRPFAEGITGVSRLVRDTARDLGKHVRLEVLGERTRVDRDILERLEAPISHLISNAIDHGIEMPADRVAANKPPEAHLRLHSRHENGRLVITVRDDGRGISRPELRETIVRRNLVSAETARGLSDTELLEFLFLPGFSTRMAVSNISGRGVGLNVVQSMVQEAGGSVTVTSSEGAGSVFRLTLPITRSVIKVITVLVEGELYAVPLVRIDRVAQLEAWRLDDGQIIGHTANDRVNLVSLASLLGLSSNAVPTGSVFAILCGGIGFAVDRLVDEVELSVRRLDARLGRIPGISAASLDENGVPLLILDVDDLIQAAHGRPAPAEPAVEASLAPHILVVDDSHTVREMERRLLVRAGYLVTTAQNGLEAWNLLRLNNYDLLVSDVDMPQMNGIELVQKVRDNPRLARMPVIILSYKDREHDRRRGLEAGADFYLTKGDFQNDTFRQAVVDLIGEPGLLQEHGDHPA